MKIDNIDARIAAARAMGLSDKMADEIQIINGVPEWRPEKPKEQEVEDHQLDVNWKLIPWTDDGR